MDRIGLPPSHQMHPLFDAGGLVHYFAEEADADAAISSNAIQEILNLAGSWSDLNWDVVEEELYRIRHENRPTPPISVK